LNVFALFAAPVLVAGFAACAVTRALKQRLGRLSSLLLVLCIPPVVYAATIGVLWWLAMRGFDGTCGPHWMDLDSRPWRRPCTWDAFASRAFYDAIVFSTLQFLLSFPVVLAVHVATRISGSRRERAIARTQV
jgi:hypothetical protein